MIQCIARASNAPRHCVEGCVRVPPVFRLRTVAVVGVLAFLVAACGGGAPSVKAPLVTGPPVATGPSVATGAAPAKVSLRGQTISVYAIWPEQYVTPIFKQFEDETGAKIKFIRQSSGQILARVEAEKDRPQADVIFGGPAETFIPAKTKGLLEKYVPPGAKDIAADQKDPDGFWHGLALDPLAFMANEKFLKDKGLQPPRSWQDLLDPAYLGRLQMANAQTSGTGYSRVATLVRLMGEDAAFEYMKKLNANVQVYTSAGAGGAIPVVQGEAAAGVFFIVDALDVKDKGSPVVVSFPAEGTGLSVEAIALVKGGPNPVAAKALIDWAASSAMQSLYSKFKINFVPSVSGVPIRDGLDISGIKYVDVPIQWAGDNRKRLVDRFVNEILKK